MTAGGRRLARPAEIGTGNGIRPLAIVALAVAGCAISAYLAAFELGWLHSMWDPVFGDGSRRVLTSAVSRAFPVPDAVLGALAYAADALLAALVAMRLPPLTVRRWLVMALAVIVAVGALVGIGLAILQPITVGTFCTLCLCSSAISVALAGLVLPEARAIDHHVTQEARP